ncbi:putative membrane protein YkoI [Nocardioides daedukensis]|uniref:Putative membrane protein YkoI n=1 Tax=Nocardioides daedukensis TaxID=634462 RepID=A0A7Y9S482_9ACTN|nr:PepSY domain-containing protein [Nocardioides daedukensis]NYG59120.1 putative membrane protein YkoI [Nocardioides daedukensis]
MNESHNGTHEDNQAQAAAGGRGRRTRRVLIPAVAAIAVLGIGGAVWAGVADDDLGDAERDKLSGVAVKAAGGGQVTEAEEDDGFYEVEVTREDGTQVDVRLDKDRKVVSTETEGPDDDGDDSDDGEGRDDRDDSTDGDDRDDNEAPLTAAETAAAKKAALAEIGGGTVTDVDRDDDGGGSGGYEVEVTKTDGTEWSVRLDANHKVLSSNRDD